MPKKGVPWKRPGSFFRPAQIIKRPFRKKPNFQRKSAFWEASPTKNPIFTEEFWKGLWKIEETTEKNDTSRLVRTALLPLFFLEKLVSRKSPSWKTHIRETKRDNWASQSSDENTYENPVFLDNQDSRPHYWTHRGPITEPMNPQIRPHYRSLQHIYIYECTGSGVGNMHTSGLRSTMCLCFLPCLSASPNTDFETHFGDSFSGPWGDFLAIDPRTILTELLSIKDADFSRMSSTTETASGSFKCL